MQFYFGLFFDHLIDTNLWKISVMLFSDDKSNKFHWVGEFLLFGWLLEDKTDEFDCPGRKSVKKLLQCMIFIASKSLKTKIIIFSHHRSEKWVEEIIEQTGFHQMTSIVGTHSSLNVDTYLVCHHSGNSNEKEPLRKRMTEYSFSFYLEKIDTRKIEKEKSFHLFLLFCFRKVKIDSYSLNKHEYSWLYKYIIAFNGLSWKLSTISNDSSNSSQMFYSLYVYNRNVGSDH